MERESICADILLDLSKSMCFKTVGVLVSPGWTCRVSELLGLDMGSPGLDMGSLSFSELQPTQHFQKQREATREPVPVQLAKHVHLWKSGPV